MNLTQFEEKILKEIPGLTAHQKGQDILLTFEKDGCLILSEALTYTDAIIITKAANIL